MLNWLAVSPISSILEPNPPGAFRIGDVIVRAWSIFSRNFWIFVLITGASQLPTLLAAPDWAKLYPGKGMPSSEAIVAFSLLLLAEIILTSLAQAVVVCVTLRRAEGQPANLAAAFGAAGVRLLPVIGVALLVGLLTGLGCLLCLVPGMIAMTALMVAVPVCVMERLGPVKSLRRSADLTSGYRWPIFAVGMAWGVIRAVAGLCARATPLAWASPVGWVTLAAQVVSSGFIAVYVAILYSDLAALKERDWRLRLSTR
jgi:hypothetical protein